MNSKDNFKDKLAFFNSNKKKEDNKQEPNKINKNTPSNKKIDNKIDNTNDKIQNKEKSEIKPSIKNSESVQNKTDNGSNQSTNVINTAKIGNLINGKHPINGSIKVEEIISRKNKDNKLLIYKYPINIEYSSNEESISVLFIGPSGSGKSTFINAYINYLLGITCNDNIRYKLIFNDAEKEKDQTQSQTDVITIYYLRSLKYNNKLFKLIDTPGAGDTRYESDIQISAVEKDKMEKKFLAMYNKLFSEEIGQLNSIVFVVKASENRYYEFQKKIEKNIAEHFDEDIGQNYLAILTHADYDDENETDAVQLMKRMPIFKEKSKNNEKWYYPVSSTSYFVPFRNGLGNPSEGFEFTEESFIKFTEKILSLKVYLTKSNQKNLDLKNRQENAIKILKENILVNLISNIKKLKDINTNLKQKMEECYKHQEENLENKITNFPRTTIKG